MDILLIGGGGREHALARKIAQSPLCGMLYIAPGNAGTAELGINVDLAAKDFDAVARFVAERKIGMVVVGPEDPLVAGIVDDLEARPELAGVELVGPTAAAAQLEGSKRFAKEFMQRHNIPTARYLSVTEKNIDEGKSFLRSLKAPYVLKADGLAAGKGVVITSDIDEAQTILAEILGGKFGDAGRNVVIEEYLDGIEVSFFALTDGQRYVMLPEAKDYKRVGDGDTGLNTGGMGAVSPVPFCDEAFRRKVAERVIAPTVAGLATERLCYRGFLFFGLMNVGGDPYVIEYNCRMGDPETEVVMPRLDSDLVELMQAAAQGDLGQREARVSERTAVTVICAAQGYPGSYPKGETIKGLDEIGATMPDSFVYHAGTKRAEGGTVESAGGRVLAVTSLGDDIAQARARSYDAIGRIGWASLYHRSDIGLDLIK